MKKKGCLKYQTCFLKLIKSNFLINKGFFFFSVLRLFFHFFAYFDKLYLTTSFIFILTFSSEKSDTGTTFINRGCSRIF